MFMKPQYRQRFYFIRMKLFGLEKMVLKLDLDCLGKLPSDLRTVTAAFSVAFTMYDLNKNGFITRDEFKVILDMMVGANITPEQVLLEVQ